jgi:hypothetical protein
VITLLLIPTVLGFLNRIRGGLFGDKIRKVLPWYGTTIGRLIYSSGVGASALILGGGPVLAASLVGTTFLGLAIAPFAPFQFMERSNDILIMSLRGLILVGASSVAMASLHSVGAGLITLLAGALMGPVYLLGQRLPLIPVLNDDPATVDKNDTSEVLYGILTGILLLIALLTF